VGEEERCRGQEVGVAVGFVEGEHVGEDYEGG
jgi:hypothetical protein